MNRFGVAKPHLMSSRDAGAGRTARALAVALAVLAAACSSNGEPGSTGATTGAADPCTGWAPQRSGGTAASVGAGLGPRELADRCLRLNDIQVIGSHNSYHVEPEEPVASALAGFDPALAESLQYTHAPLREQLGAQGIRQLELDVFADPEGGRYARRNLLPVLGLPADSGIPALDEPGFKVLHVQEVDFLSRCWTLVECLREIDAWSDANPRHLPLAILIEVKDEEIPDPVGVFVQPLPIGPRELDALDAEIRSVFEPDELVTPDDVRGDAATLEDAVLADGWPRLGEARGKVLFLLDNGGGYRDDYLAGHPSLQGRVLFTSSEPGQPDAAFVKRNDPTGEHRGEIRRLVRQGYVVRTRADADTVQARTGDTSQRDAALASGAHWVSTDYPVPGMAARFRTAYVVQLPGGLAARCNPVTTGPACDSAAVADER